MFVQYATVVLGNNQGKTNLNLSRIFDKPQERGHEAVEEIPYEVSVDAVQSRRERVQPRLHEALPAQAFRLHVDHSTT